MISVAIGRINAMMQPTVRAPYMIPRGKSALDGSGLAPLFPIRIKWSNTWKLTVQSKIISA